MKRDKYLNALRRFLENKKIKNVDEIVKKYETKIEEETQNGKSIKEVLNSFISFDEIYKEEKRKKFNFKINFPDILPSIKKINYIKILLYILAIILSLSFVFTLVIFFSSLFLVLDGANTYGVSVLLLSISALNLICLLIINKSISGARVNFKKYINVMYVNFAFIALGISLVLFQYYKLDVIDDVKEKYETKTIEKDITLSTDSSGKYYIYFNSWYDNKYIIHYDNELSNTIKIRLEYYECFYNSQITTKFNSVYISLIKDSRDLLSFYMENLRENEIYNAKELSRNIINIYVSEEDYKRIIFVD